MSPRFKCVWSFICDECDKAGMWEIDLDSLNFCLNDEQEFTQRDFEAFLLKINEDREENEVARIELYKNKKVWITGFTSFQYGELSSTCIPHKNIIEKLNSYGLLHRVPVRVQTTLTDRVGVTHKKGKEKTGMEGKGIEEEKNVLENQENFEETTQEEIPPVQPPKTPKTPNILPDNLETVAERRWYEANILAERDNMPVPDLKMKIAEYIQQKKPRFIEAYMDLWNLSATGVGGTGVPGVQKLNDTRLRKFKTRLREPAFDFVQILTEIKLSGHLRGEKGWKVTFDWILENDSNYVKILEGQYRNKN